MELLAKGGNGKNSDPLFHEIPSTLVDLKRDPPKADHYGLTSLEKAPLSTNNFLGIIDESDRRLFKKGGNWGHPFKGLSREKTPLLLKRRPRFFH